MIWSAGGQVFWRSIKTLCHSASCAALPCTDGVQLGRRWLAQLRRQSPDLEEAAGLAEAFTFLVCERVLDCLKLWLEHAADGAGQQFHRFAKRLSADHNAVRGIVALS